jgi:hypothetical protein
MSLVYVESRQGQIAQKQEDSQDPLAIPKLWTGVLSGGLSTQRAISAQLHRAYGGAALAAFLAASLTFA